MCLNSKKSEEEKEEWLKDKPETIITYKKVIKHEGKFYPPYIDNPGGKPYLPKGEMNTITREPYRAMIVAGPIQKIRVNPYSPYFHLFVAKKGTDGMLGNAVIKCEVPKKDITVVGEQKGHEVIVSRSFKITRKLWFNRF